MQTPLIERVKLALHCKTYRELAAKIGVHESQISKWRRTGFYPSTESLVNLLLEEIERTK